KNEIDLPAPGGFVVSARAYQEFLGKNDLEKFIEDMLEQLDVEDAGKLEKLSNKIKDKFLGSDIPENVQEEISQAVNVMLEKYGDDVLVAVRSSAVGEDGDISFAGQYSSYINIKGRDIPETYKKVLASKYNSGALAYRKKHGLREDDTPMCVVITTMIRAQASGVMYTQDPAAGKESVLKISAGYGFGQRIVSGEDTGDEYVVNKSDLKIENLDISPKKKMYSYGNNKWPRLMDVPEELQEKQVLSHDEIQLMARYGLSLEKFFRQAQDVEWVRSEEGDLLIVQARPLRLIDSNDNEGPDEETFITDYPLIISGGKTASRGRWIGKVYMAKTPRDLSPVKDAVLVTKTADPRYTEYLGRVGAVVSEVGSVTSHLASVAREYGVPAIFGMNNVFSELEDGQEVSVDAINRKIYQGMIKGFSSVPGMMSPSQPQGFNQRLKAVLDHVSTLNLVNPDAPEFQLEECRTVHDVIRFLHEKIISEMFRSEHDHRNYAILKSNIPLKIRMIDLGGGLTRGLTTCDEPVPDDIRSVPLAALWQGVSYPGINWSQSIGFSFANLGQLMTTPESESMKVVETVSYALVARDYMNLSIKFGYHYANIEALCTDRVSQNLVNFQFSGGAGGYLGRSLRVLLLAEILEKLDFETDIQGDFLGASLKGFECESIQEKLDQVGRLLACSRLLDMVLKNEDDVQRLAARFMEGDYDFLSAGQSNPMPDFHLFEGSWKVEEDSSGKIFIQDGKRIVDPVSRKMAC
ncbi:MAG: PEP/pyruvate-binding domain-containing protein, partial [Desulfonatronovibrio sp.]